MHFSSVVLPLAFALTAASEAHVPSKALPAGAVYAREIVQRDDVIDLKPEDVCGQGFDRCNDSYCCLAGTTCAGELNGIPMCKDPTKTDDILGGSQPAIPYANVDEILTSLDGLLSSLGGELPTALPTNLQDIPGFKDAETTAADGRPGPTGSPQNGGDEGNAARGLDVGGSFRGLGAVAVGGVAMLGGAGWLLM